MYERRRVSRHRLRLHHHQSCVLIGPTDGQLLLHHYQSNKRQPGVPLSAEQLTKLYELCGDRVHSSSVRRRHRLRRGPDPECAFGVDFGLVETVAHFRAAPFLPGRRFHHRHRRSGYQVLQNPQQVHRQHLAQRGVLVRLRLVHRDVRPARWATPSRNSASWVCSQSTPSTSVRAARCS